MASPTDKATIVTKIVNGEIKVKSAKRTHVPKVKAPKAEKPKATAQATRGKLEFSEAAILEAVRAVGHPAVSREISDKLGIADADRGRSYVRTRMQALIKDGKIKTDVPAEKSRATFLYSVAEA